MTSFVDLDAGRPGPRCRAGSARDQHWRDRVEVVALDPSAPFAAAVRRLLPQATVVV